MCIETAPHHHHFQTQIKKSISSQLLAFIALIHSMNR